MPEPRLKPHAGGDRDRHHSLGGFARRERLHEHRDPVCRPEGRVQELDRRISIGGGHRAQLPALVSETRPVKVELDNVAQSTPEKSASIVRSSAFPTLSRVPVHPRGD